MTLNSYLSKSCADISKTVFQAPKGGQESLNFCSGVAAALFGSRLSLFTHFRIASCYCGLGVIRHAGI